MYKYCNTEAGSLRQRHIEQCLLELMADRSLAQITIGDICALAGLSRKSFYRYFDSKEGCFHALLDHVIMDGSAYYIPETGNDNPALTFCCRVFQYWQTQTSLLDALERNGQSLQILQRMVSYVLEEDPEYVNHSGFSQYNTMEHVVFNISGVMGLILAWHHDHYQKTAEQMGGILYQMMKTQNAFGGN